MTKNIFLILLFLIFSCEKDDTPSSFLDTHSEKMWKLVEDDRYNSINFDTIFSKDVVVDYLENKITSEYLDFSIKRNSMIISRNVVYTNLENILRADVIEVDVKTKDTKIYMYEKEKQVRVKNIE